MLITDYVIQNMEKLPPHLQEELMHYSEYLLTRYLKEHFPLGNKKKRGGWGVLEGKIWMADDFDEPLEDMKDYM